MPDPIQDLIAMPALPDVSVRLEPAHNALYSLLLLYKAEHMSGLGEWVTYTASALTPRERERHALVLNGFYYAILPEQSWPSFSAYVDHLAALDPIELRDKLLRIYARVPLLDEQEECKGLLPEPVHIDVTSILESLDTYLAFLSERFSPEHLDKEIESQAYVYACDPPAMQELIVSHLRTMWTRYLAPEWEQVTSMLQTSVQAFGHFDFTGMSKFEAAQAITGRELEEKWNQAFDEVEQVIFVPSAHIGPYLSRSCIAGRTLWVFFGARLPKGVPFQSPDLSRAEILVRLNALADSNRLRILKLLEEKGELNSQKVILELGLSQSTVSRHLKQLCATGYLLERRCNGAKCYKLDRDRIQDTLQAISAFLLGS